MFSSGTNGQAGAPAPFSFGATSTSFGSTPSSNPFSVSTSFGGNTQSTTNGFSFGGFNAGSQPTPSFGGFGAQQNTTAPASTPASTPASNGLFGKSTAHITSPADDSMQTSPDTKPKGGSIFAPKPAAGASPLGNPFSNLSGQNASNPFAPTKVTATDQTTAKPAESQPFKPLFGSTPAAAKPSSEEKEQPKATNPFANLSGSTSTTTSNLFAPKTPAADATPAKPAEAAKPFGTLFGSKSSSQPPESVSNMFTPKPAAEEPKPSNPFANLSTPSSFTSSSSLKVTGTEEGSGKAAEAQPFKPLFGTPATSKTSEDGKESTATPAFGNMFSPKPAAENAVAKPAGDQPFKPLFGTPAVSKTSEAGKESAATPAFGNMFSPKPTGEDGGTKPADDQPLKAMFGTPAAFKASDAGKGSIAAPAFGNMFSPKPTAENVAAKHDGDQSFKSMFGTPVTTKPAAADKEQPAASSVFAPTTTSQGQISAPAKTPQFGSMFGASPAPPKFGEGPAAQETPSNPFANLSGQNAVANPFAPKTTEQAAKPLAPSTSLFSANNAIETKDNSKTVLDASLANPFTASPKAANEPVKESATATTTTIQASPSQSSVDASKSDSLPFPSSSFLLPSSSSTSTVSNTSTSNTVLASNTFVAPKTDSLFPQPESPVSIEYPDLMPLKRLVPGFESNPRHANEAALLWKLRMMTESFKREVAKCDPMTDDIDEVILLYVDLRRELGVPIGSIDPIEEAERAELIHQDAVEEAANGKTPARQPSPPTFSPPRLSSTDTPSTNKPSSGSSTSSKFAQSFSAPTPAPAPTSVDASQTPVAAPAASTFTAPASAAPATAAPAASSTTAPAFSIPKFGAGTTSTAGPSFEIPKFGAGATGTDFMAQFKAKADKTAAEEKAKRKAEDFDSDEENEEEWERKDAERQLEKKAQHEAAAKKRAVFVPGQGFKFVDEDTASQSAEGPVATASTATDTTAPSAPSESSTIFGATQSSPAPTTLFGAKPGSPSPTLDAGPRSSTNTSVFGSNTSVFGSSQPVPASQNIFGGLKPTSPKRKASADESDNEDDSPVKKVKSTPPASSTGASIFGRVSTPTTPSNTLFPAVSTTSSTPAAPASSSLQPATTTPSAPVTEPTAATEDEEGEPEEIFDLTRGNGGEEEETVLFEDKSRAFKLDGQWVSKGTGPVRVLQHPVTKRARIVARAEPSGNVILNTLLKKEFDYSLTTNSVQFMVPEEDGKVRHWALRVKRERLQEFHDLIQKIKN